MSSPAASTCSSMSWADMVEEDLFDQSAEPASSAPTTPEPIAISPKPTVSGLKASQWATTPSEAILPAKPTTALKVVAEQGLAESRWASAPSAPKSMQPAPSPAPISVRHTAMPNTAAKPAAKQGLDSSRWALISPATTRANDARATTATSTATAAQPKAEITVAINITTTETAPKPTAQKTTVIKPLATKPAARDLFSLKHAPKRAISKSAEIMSWAATCEKSAEELMEEKSRAIPEAVLEKITGGAKSTLMDSRWA